LLDCAYDREAVAEETNDLMNITPMESGLFSLGWGYATQIVREG